MRLLEVNCTYFEAIRGTLLQNLYIFSPNSYFIIYYLSALASKHKFEANYEAVLGSLEDVLSYKSLDEWVSNIKLSCILLCLCFHKHIFDVKVRPMAGT